MSSPFVHLHCHSYYSLLWGVPSPEALCRAARTRGMTALALTDINALYGAVRFWEAARDAGIAPILGAEVRDGADRAVLLAESHAGYRRLSAILTDRHTGEGFSLAGALREDRDGLVVLSGNLDLLEPLAASDGPTGLYLEVLPGRSHHASLDGARRRGIPPVACFAAAFVDPAAYRIHRLLRAIALNTTLGRLTDADCASPQDRLMDAAEAATRLPHIPDACARTVEIAERCRMERPPWGEVVFPAYKGFSADEAFADLRRRCLKGVRERYGGMNEAVRSRLDYELAIIRDKHFAPYFLVVADIVARAPRTCGRGSAAASIVSYLLGITHVDPVRHDLFFERFLNPGRVDPPDIDVDFPWDERDGVIRDVLASFGPDHAAMVSNHVGFKARAAVREIAKVYGLPDAEIGRVTGRMGYFWSAAEAARMTRDHPAFRGMDLGDPWPEILALAARLEGHPRHLSVHCGGVVVTPGPIRDHVPLETAAKGVPIIQWEKDATEDAGLVKIDLLGNRSLAVIRDALRAVEANYGVRIPYERFNPLEDMRTQEMLAAGDTIGVFYVESPAMRQLQKKTAKGDFDHLVIHSSIIRPAANEFIREYIKRLHGAPYEPLHPILERTLAETHGVMCYQEDVAKVAIAMAGFDAACADELRKILSKKHKVKRLADLKERFFAGAAERGIERDVVDRVWAMIGSFSGYSFCKPHSASYAMVSFKACYLRAHYPAEFMAAVISNEGGYYSTLAYISEARRMGLEILPADVNASGIHYAGANGALRVGLMQLKGVRRGTIEAVVAGREPGPYCSLEDFLERADPEPSDARIMIRAGCLDSIAGGRGRAGMAWEVMARAAAGKRDGRGLSLFPPAREAAPPVTSDGYDEAAMLRHEVEALGILISRHPLALYRRRLERLKFVKARDLGQYVGKRVTMIGWFVTAKTILTKDRKEMEFASFEDTTAIYETTFFPRAYSRFCHMLSRTRPYVLRGKVDEDFGAVSLGVEDLWFLDQAGKR